MNNEHDIDKLLKESFDDFLPDAPDVWQAVQQGVQAAQTAAAASSGVAGATVQGIGLTVKMIAAIVIAAAAITTYVVLNNTEPTVTPQQTAIIINDATVIEPETTPETTNTNQIPVTGKVPATQNNTHTTKPKPTNQPATAVAQTANIDNTIPVSEEYQRTAGARTEVKNDIIGVPVKKETPAVEEAKTGGNSTVNNTEKGLVKQPDKNRKPYNSNANYEEGEQYEKPTIPGSFSPNNDGLNDQFEIQIENESYYQLVIMDGNGQTVFESKNKDQVWDGKHYKTGVMCPVGNYFYVLKYQYKGSDNVHDKAGPLRLFL